MIKWILSLGGVERWAIGLAAFLFSGIIIQWFSQRLSHALAVIRERSNKTIMAKTKLRESFAPAQSRIKITAEDSTAICNFVGSFLPDHAAAVEEFREFIPQRKRGAYQKAWDEYHRIATQGAPKTRGEAWGQNLTINQLFEEKIQGIISFAKNE